MSELNDYQTAKGLIGTVKKGKQASVVVVDLKQFRKYLSGVAKEANQKFTTRDMGDWVLVVRIT